MKSMNIIVAVLTGLFLFSTVVCGLWLRYSGEVITEGSKNFHMISAFLTTAFVVITMVLVFRQ